MDTLEAAAIVGGRVKPGPWQAFSRPVDWESKQWSWTGHLTARCLERDIPREAVESLIDRADIFVPLPGRRYKLGLSRRAIRRAEHDPSLTSRSRRVTRLTAIVDVVQRVVITGWFGPKRRSHPKQFDAVPDGSTEVD